MRDDSPVSVGFRQLRPGDENMPGHLPERCRDPGDRKPAALAEIGHHLRAEPGRTIAVTAHCPIMPAAGRRPCGI